MTLGVCGVKDIAEEASTTQRSFALFDVFTRASS